MEPLNAALRHLPVAAVYLAGGVPALVLLMRAALGDLGADPVKALEHALGLHALQFLLVGLAITPLRRWVGVNLIRYRRAVGLLAFYYALAHLTVWVVLDLQFRWAEIGADLAKRPYVMFGMAGFALLVPLALTSSDAMVRRLGVSAWRRLHRLVYPAVLGAAVHFVMVAKTWQVESLAYLGATAVLVAMRVAAARPGPIHPRREPRIF